jgi:hypothetical protein
MTNMPRAVPGFDDKPFLHVEPRATAGPDARAPVDSDTRNGEPLKVNEGPLLRGSSSAPVCRP